jgi:hypothetical protein
MPKFTVRCTVTIEVVVDIVVEANSWETAAFNAADPLLVGEIRMDHDAADADDIVTISTTRIVCEDKSAFDLCAEDTTPITFNY